MVTAEVDPLEKKDLLGPVVGALQIAAMRGRLLGFDADDIITVASVVNTSAIIEE
jgi:hypothetical protein